MKTPALAALLAALLATAPMAPVLAGSSIAVTIAPSNPDEAQALRVGLALFALHQDIRSNGHVTQHGANNAAGIYQGGPNNQAIVHQEGQGHHGTISQTGANNAYGLFQFGQNTSADVVQTGGQAGLTLLFGW